MQQVLESGSVILSLAYNVTASPWPIATSRLMLTLALVEMNGRDCRRIQFPCEWQRQHEVAAYLADGREGSAKIPGETPGMGKHGTCVCV